MGLCKVPAMVDPAAPDFAMLLMHHGGSHPQFLTNMLVERENLQAHWKTMHGAIRGGLQALQAQGGFEGKITLVLCDLYQGVHVASAWATLLKYYFTRCKIPVKIETAAVGDAPCSAGGAVCPACSRAEIPEWLRAACDAVFFSEG